MHKNPYQCWDIDTNILPKTNSNSDIFAWVLNYAILAPSAHNAQPWRFEYNEGKLLVNRDIEKELHKSDPALRQSLLSIGCCLQNIVTALEAINCEYDLAINLDAEARRVAVVTLNQPQNIEPQNHNILHLMTNRRSDRRPYDSTLLDGETITKIEFSQEQEIKIDVVADGRLSEVRQIMFSAFKDALNDAEFRKELSEWIKPNITSDSDGMPGFTLNIPTLPSLFVPWLLRKVNITKLLAKEHSNLLNSAQAIAVLSVKDDSRKMWVKAGMVAQKSFLTATDLGVSTHVLNAAVEMGSYYLGVQKILNVEYKPVMMWRLGYIEGQMPHSPRKSVAKVTSINK